MLEAFLESSELEEFIDIKRKRERSSLTSSVVPCGSWSSLKRSRRTFNLTSLEEENGRNYSSSFSSDDSDSTTCTYRFRIDSCSSSSVLIHTKEDRQDEDTETQVALSLGSMCFELNMKAQLSSKSNDAHALSCYTSEKRTSNISTLTFQVDT
ncbi:hypothetical protein EON65_00085 [archaeon]|nr:MAG: hypothetical protein EON65_00085 [archaeon]